MSTNKAKKQLKEIKSFDFSKWSVTFWLVKRKVVQKDANYSMLRVNIDAKLQRRFRGYLKAQLQNKEFHVSEYDFNNADGDDALFTISTDITDFVKVAAAIDDGFNNPHAKTYEELLNSWAYIALFEKDGKRLFAWRKINADTQPKKVKSKNATFFQDHKLVDLDDKEIFLIDPRYDFFVYEGTTFIANKRQFESSMNFREGMKANGDEVLADFEKLKIFDNVGIIKEFVGTNLHHLRKLSSIRKSGYYKQPDYMQKLIRVNTSEKWELKIVKGKIVVEKETVELLLKLLNNDRLRSPINNELFDSAAKAPVATGGAA
ncbi:DUF4868 domain-containing protein [Pseudomonas aeruginosa]|uniref:DUF4868 domain-containing protein n=1 Tax=Pseudomonas aeruginosa TaxID=287 RepID=UPI001CD2DDD3|nr:DUF4868 domain-containing protein [Pseudomonas aeruginosa]HCF6146628.1 DUF4868 domain-containing protein [Pseudomonas aeruginosa]